MLRSIVRSSFMLVVPSLAVAASVACSSPTSPEELGSAEGALKRIGEGPGPITVKDAGTTTDTGAVDTGSSPVVVGNAPATATTSTGPTSCAPRRIDLIADGRTCWAFAKLTPTGVWSVAPIFADGPPAMRDTHCALTWIANAPACAEPDVGALGLGCNEFRSMTQRSAACAANPATCTTTATSSTRTTSETKDQVHQLGCDPIFAPDAGVIPTGYSGGCDACGEVFGGKLYGINPFPTTTIVTNVWNPDGSTRQLAISAPAYGTFVLPLSTATQEGSVSLWRQDREY